jgi:hypothetical protein
VKLASLRRFCNTARTQVCFAALMITLHVNNKEQIFQYCPVLHAFWNVLHRHSVCDLYVRSIAVLLTAVIITPANSRFCNTAGSPKVLYTSSDGITRSFYKYGRRVFECIYKYMSFYRFIKKLMHSFASSASIQRRPLLLSILVCRYSIIP